MLIEADFLYQLITTHLSIFFVLIIRKAHRALSFSSHRPEKDLICKALTLDEYLSYNRNKLNNTMR